MSWSLDILLHQNRQKDDQQIATGKLCICWKKCEAQECGTPKKKHSPIEVYNVFIVSLLPDEFLPGKKRMSKSCPPKSRKRSTHFSSRTTHMPNESRLATSVGLDFSETSWAAEQKSGTATAPTPRDSRMDIDGYRRMMGFISGNDCSHPGMGRDSGYRHPMFEPSQLNSQHCGCLVEMVGPLYH